MSHIYTYTRTTRLDSIKCRRGTSATRRRRPLVLVEIKLEGSPAVEKIARRNEITQSTASRACACACVPLYRIDATKIDFSVTQSRGEREREGDKERRKESGDELFAGQRSETFLHRNARTRVFSSSFLDTIFNGRCLIRFFPRLRARLKLCLIFI